MDDEGSADPFLMVPVEDSEDARLFIELSSYGSDLTEAGHALDLAMRGGDVESPSADARPFLVGFAAMAYCRCFTHSVVRGRLTDRVAVPDDLTAIHEQVRALRNRTIAHSQSDLSVTYALGVLDALTLDVRDVSAVTINGTLPHLVVGEFRALVAAMVTLLDEVLMPVRDRLAEQFRAVERTELLARPTPTVVEKSARDFDPKSTRLPYSASHTIYGEAVGDDGEPTADRGR